MVSYNLPYFVTDTVELPIKAALPKPVKPGGLGKGCPMVGICCSQLNYLFKAHPMVSHFSLYFTSHQNSLAGLTKARQWVGLGLAQMAGFVASQRNSVSKPCLVVFHFLINFVPYTAKLPKGRSAPSPPIGKLG